MHYVHLIYFSPTGNTKKVSSRIGQIISAQTGFELRIHDFTFPQMRLSYPSIQVSDIVILATPVYAGRVPNLMVPYIKGIHFNGAKCIALVTYGNRNYDDALLELSDMIRQENGNLVGAAAFVGEHSFSKVLASGRPNCKDLDEAENFAYKVLENIYNNRGVGIGYDTGIVSLKPHYMPKFADGKPIDLRKVKPRTSSDCISCKLCIQICPMGAINFQAPSEVEGICIKCCACVKQCPVGAKYFDSDAFLYHKEDLEEKYSSIDKANELFV